MFRRFVTALAPTPTMCVLDVGVTSDTQQQESNYFERFYPYPAQVTVVGTEDGSHLTGQYPGLRYPTRRARQTAAVCHEPVRHRLLQRSGWNMRAADRRRRRF